MNLKRIGYYTFFAIGGLFFLVQLFVSTSARLANGALIKSTGLLVMIIILYISRTEKSYLISSIPLRIVIGMTSLLGMAAVILTMGVIQ